MDDYSKFIDFLSNNDFSLIENRADRVFIYEHDGFFIKIMQELGGKRFVSLSRTNNHPSDGWYDMQLVRFCILKSGYDKSNNIVRFKELSEFFIEHFAEIAEAFDASHFLATKEKLNALELERARIQYGYKW